MALLDGTALGWHSQTLESVPNLSLERWSAG
jgi:hypothetical protein